ARVGARAPGASTDAVVDGTTGVLVPPGQTGLFARRVRDLLSSPLRLEAFGIAAADRAHARYSWDRISRETLAVYEHCLRPAAASLAGARGRRLTPPGRPPPARAWPAPPPPP